jgi:hypothetical protein
MHSQAAATLGCCVPNQQAASLFARASWKRIKASKLKWKCYLTAQGQLNAIGS